MKFRSLEEGNFFVYNWNNPNFSHELFIKDKSKKDAFNLRTNTREKFSSDSSVLRVIFDMELLRKQEGEKVSKQERGIVDTLGGLVKFADQ